MVADCNESYEKFTQIVENLYVSCYNKRTTETRIGDDTHETRFPYLFAVTIL